MDNPFNWDYLTTVPGPNEVFGPLAVLFLILFGVGFAISVVLYNGWGRAAFPNPVLFRMARRWAAWGVVVFGLGIFFFVIRAVQINPFTFGERIWLWLCFLGVLAWLAVVAWDLRTNYPPLLAEHQAQQSREQYRKKSLGVQAGRSGAAVVPTAGRPVKRRRR